MIFYDILCWVCWFWCSSWFLLCSLWLVVCVDELAEMMNSICGFSMSLGCDPGSASRTGWVLKTHQLQPLNLTWSLKIEIPIPKFVFLMLAHLDSIKFRGCTSIRINDQCGRKRARPAMTCIFAVLTSSRWDLVRRLKFWRCLEISHWKNHRKLCRWFVVSWSCESCPIQSNPVTSEPWNPVRHQLYWRLDLALLFLSIGLCHRWHVAGASLPHRATTDGFHKVWKPKRSIKFSCGLVPWA